MLQGRVQCGEEMFTAQGGEFHAGLGIHGGSCPVLPGGSTADRWPLTPGPLDPEAAGPSHLPDKKDETCHTGATCGHRQDTCTALKCKVP